MTFIVPPVQRAGLTSLAWPHLPEHNISYSKLLESFLSISVIILFIYDKSWSENSWFTIDKLVLVGFICVLVTHYFLEVPYTLLVDNVNGCISDEIGSSVFWLNLWKSYLIECHHSLSLSFNQYNFRLEYFREPLTHFCAFLVPTIVVLADDHFLARKVFVEV